MSEADTPNNQPLPNPTASTDDSITPLQDATETSEEPKVINLFQLPPAKEIEQRESLEETIDSESVTILEEEDRGTEIVDTSEQERNKDADWFALAQKMRQRNRRLLDQVNELKQALKEKQEALNTELVRSQDRDLLLTRQAEELHTLQGQLTRLFHTLESSHQAAQRQQILIDTLSEQLQSSQERVAQLERECALTQQRYNEQSHQLMQAANTCRELRTRLHRQQQQTLQFKMALEKCLEMPASSLLEQQQSRYQRDTTNPAIAPKTQPIQPWSAQFDQLEEQADINSLWNRPIQLEPLSNLSSSEAEQIQNRPIEDTDRLSIAETTTPIQTPIQASQDTIATELEADEQLLAEMKSLAEASGLSESVSDLAESSTELMSESERNLVVSDESTISFWDSEEHPLLEDQEEVNRQDEVLWEDTGNRELNSTDEVILPQSNWPSPVLYPLRRPRKIKSLAAIELPSFPRYRST